jgi:hypothetical protein
MASGLFELAVIQKPPLSLLKVVLMKIWRLLPGV